MSEKRIVQLVAREAILRQLIENEETLPFHPDALENVAKCLELMYSETRQEMESLGLTQDESPD